MLDLLQEYLLEKEKAFKTQEVEFISVETNYKPKVYSNIYALPNEHMYLHHGEIQWPGIYMGDVSTSK